MSATLWSPDHYVAAYELAREGCNQEEIAAGLGVSLPTLQNWLRAKPAFRRAVEQGKTRVTGKLSEYVYHQLSPEARALYDQLAQAENLPNATARLEALMAGHGKQMQQLMILQAALDYGFNMSRALRRCGVPYNTFKRWVQNDPEFGKLWDEVLWHKKNYVESALMGLVQRGNPAAIIHANKTINADRGYADLVKVEATHHHEHTLAIDLGELDLPPEVAMVVLRALEAKQEQKMRDADSIEATQAPGGPYGRLPAPPVGT